MNSGFSVAMRICGVMALCLLAAAGCTSEKVPTGMARMNAFAESYTKAWSSGNPASVASHFAENGSLRINQNPPSVGRDALASTAKSFMTELPDLTLSMDSLDKEGERFIYKWTLRGTNTGPGGSGHPIDISGYEEWTMSSSGLILESQGHMDLDDYQRQLTAESPASSATDGEREAIIAVVQAFFDTMASKDTAQAELLLIPEGTFHSIRKEDGETVLRTFTNRSYLDELLEDIQQYRERMWNPDVRIHGDIATLWTAYDFWIDGTFSHCGIDAFDLVRIDAGWKIAGGIYTVENECKASPLGPLTQAAPANP